MSVKMNLFFFIIFFIFLTFSFPKAGEINISEPSQAQLHEQVEQYNEEMPKTIKEMQQYRSSCSINIGKQKGQAALTNLNPYVNTWFLLTIKKDQGAATDVFHLENPFPQDQTLTLSPEYPLGILIQAKDRQYPCILWDSFPENQLTLAQKSAIAFAPLCDNRLYLRNKTKGNKTTLESASDFLRRYVPAGEQITAFVKDTFYKDKYAVTSDIIKEKKGDAKQLPEQNAPHMPDIDPKYKNTSILPEELGLPLINKGQTRILCGQWYPVKDMPGIFVSAIEPQMVSQNIAEKQKKLLKPLQSVEASALVYLTAFDLSLYDLGFAMGTEHPAVNWSDRIRSNMRNNRLPGPDGIGTISPLVNTGIISPENAKKIAAAFTGGFKRYHGAFRNGPLAERNHASHYGFIEHGVVLSKLQPGLATIIVFKDKSIRMKTWQIEDNALLSTIVYARQNGVPIIEPDEANQTMPGKYVANAFYGNWSGSAEGNLRTLRSGIGIQEDNFRRFLIYAYFSTATPSAMARVFLAYHCSYAMLTDMNALEHTYMALYAPTDKGFKIHHLVKGMNVLDKSLKGTDIPRFVGFPDNRDFYYVMKKEIK